MALYDTTKIGKKAYDVYIACLASGIIGWTQNTFVKTGVFAEKPSITTPQGDTYKLNTGDEPVISANVNFEGNMANVTSANLTLLEAIINIPCAIAMVEKDAAAPISITEAPATGILIPSIMLYPELDFISNDQHVIKITGKREVGVKETRVKLGASV